MLTRRDFIKSAVSVGGLGMLSSACSHISRIPQKTMSFRVHPFVESHPEAVFIMETDVDVKANSHAIRETGLQFGQSIFTMGNDEPGSIPCTHNIVVKPNLTCSSTFSDKYPLKYSMGITTDPYFIEGMIESLKEFWIPGNQFYIRETNCPRDFGRRGYLAMAERTGADIRDLSAEIGTISANDVNWVDVPDGVLHKKIPYLWPVNTRDSWLLNIAKFKAHGMGLTLCCKNHQGNIAHHYQQMCGHTAALKKLSEKHLVRNYEDVCRTNYERHVAQGIPRWDRPGKHDTGFRMDIWAARTLDNLSVSPMGLCVIEGIYGRDGNGFLEGPNKGEYSDNEAWDYMTNVVIFGKDPIRVDIIGHWLGGHEPGNFGLFHLAVERGMLDVLNPKDIPVYRWKNGEAILTPLNDFERTPLKTYYLQQNYNGGNEQRYHLVDEEFNYNSVKFTQSNLPDRPAMQVFGHVHPGERSQVVPIEYAVPYDGYARIEILDSSMRSVIAKPADKHCTAGYHLTNWNFMNYSPGIYYCRYRYQDYDRIQKIVVT